MVATLQFTDVQWSADRDQTGNPMLDRFVFRLRVVPDATARKSTGESVAGVQPPTACYP